MSKKDIQEVRIQGYFIESAKAIIRGEGIKVLSVRNVANEAGYSYATLYNYFENLQELIIYCLKDFIEESKEFVKNTVKSSDSQEDNIIATSVAFSNYFVQYPGIFEILFLERMSQIFLSDEVQQSINLLFEELFMNLLLEVNTKETAKQKLELIKTTITGLLIFYLRRRDPKEYQDFIIKLKILIKSVL